MSGAGAKPCAPNLVFLLKLVPWAANSDSLPVCSPTALLGRMVGVAGTPVLFVNREPVASAAELETTVERILGGV